MSSHFDKKEQERPFNFNSFLIALHVKPILVARKVINFHKSKTIKKGTKFNYDKQKTDPLRFHCPVF